MKVLFLTYNGLNSHIGKAQVWPYIEGLAQRGHEVQVVSFEQPDTAPSEISRISAQAESAGVVWLPQTYSTWPGPLAKWLDRKRMLSAATRASLESDGIDIVHCRSYVPADAALQVRRRTGARFLFDMRGLWPDQRAEGGRWPQKQLIYRWLHRHWKRKEARYIHGADAIISLTEACRDEILSWPSYAGAPVHIIPCAVNFGDFRVFSQADRTKARAALGIHDQRPVFAYLGSLGSVYLLDDMIRSFAHVREAMPDAMFLLISSHSSDELHTRASELGLNLSHDSVLAVKADRSDVPQLLNAADVGYCFIMPTYSSLGVSPTKLGEYLACGLPVICNAGVGDVERIVRHAGAGLVLDGDVGQQTRVHMQEIAGLVHMNRKTIREAATGLLNLESAVVAYDRVYGSLHG